MDYVNIFINLLKEGATMSTVLTTPLIEGLTILSIFSISGLLLYLSIALVKWAIS